MIAKQASFVSIYKSISTLNKMLLLLVLVVPSIFVVKNLFLSNCEVFALDKKESASVHTLQFDYNKIGTGALALKSTTHNFSFPNVNEEVVLLGKNTRPDASLHNMILHIGLKGCDTTLMVASGQKLYLSYENQHLHFSDNITPIWIRPYVNEQLESFLAVGVYLISESGEVLLDETRTYEMKLSLKGRGVEVAQDSILNRGLTMMQGGRWWPPDHLFETYGGEKYNALVGMERLQIEQPEGACCFYVKEGTCLIWKNGKWQAATTTASYPMAQLTHIFPYKMEWTLWDKTGLEWVKVVHARESIEEITLRAEELFTKIRQRTASQVSCYVDGKTKILKKGDWLIHLPTGWHIVKNVHEVNEIVHFAKQGELFIFDGVEKVEGKSVFCGALFNKMRNQMLNIKIPCVQGVQEKRDTHPSSIRKPMETKIERTPSDEQFIQKQDLKRAYQKIRKRIQPIDTYEMVDEK